MKIAVEAYQITDVPPSLDGITVFWQDLGPSSGCVTLVCYGAATTFIDDLEREFWFEAFARHTRSKRFLAFGTPAEFADFCVLQMRERTERCAR